MAPGEVAEWSNAPHSKCGIGASLSGVRIPPSPPSHFDSEKVLQNQAFLEPPENDGVAPRWSTEVTQIAIFETPGKGVISVESYPRSIFMLSRGARALRLEAAPATRQELRMGTCGQAQLLRSRAQDEAAWNNDAIPKSSDRLWRKAAVHRIFVESKADFLAACSGF